MSGTLAFSLAQAVAACALFALGGALFGPGSGSALAWGVAAYAVPYLAGIGMLRLFPAQGAAGPLLGLAAAMFARFAGSLAGLVALAVVLRGRFLFAFAGFFAAFVLGSVVFALSFAGSAIRTPTGSSRARRESADSAGSAGSAD